MHPFSKTKLHYYFSIIILFLVSGTAMSQSNYRTDKWRYSDPKQLGFTVIDVQFFDNNLGIAVGGAGGIATTTNGGEKWKYGPFTFANPAGFTISGNFNDVHIPSATVAYAVGTNGMMAKSTNAGQDWTFVTTPLYANSRSINAVWFVNKDTGYIAGQWNTPDSIPKIYFTRNGGTTWDSLAAPAVNGTTKVGFVNNATYPSIDYPITGKAKEIQRIIFTSNSVGYISGGGASDFPNIGIPNITNTTTCAFTGTQTTGSHNASLLWKFTNGVLTDYSISKERLGYTGHPSTSNCTSKYGTVSQVVQQYRALNVVNDSLIVMVSFNNNIVIKVATGINDSTLNINRSGVYEKGRYEILNTGPSGPPPGYPQIPAVQVLFASNPYHLKKASNGKLYTAANTGALWTSVDTGRNWVRENSLPPNRNYSSFATWALDFLPNGKLVTMGQGGVMADSIPGGSFNSNYVFVGSGGNKVDFVDCNNGIITGGSGIAVTNDGGNSWINKDRADFANSFYSINGFHFARLNLAYFAVTNGVIYRSVDQGTTLDPVFSDFTYQMHEVVAHGNDTVYALGYASTLPSAQRKSSFFRSVDNGNTWQTIDIVASTATPAFTAPTLNRMTFPSRQVGYAAGTRNGVYKTIDGGTTWTSISPFPALNAGPAGFSNTFVTYTGIYALDENTVFLAGNMFTNTGIRRIYKTTDGGNTWVDITSNLPALLPSGNILSILFSDNNNGYVIGSNVLFTTNDGGTNWRMDIAPHGNLNNTMGFAPRKVPAAIPFANRKLFIAGLSFASGIPTIMEYGDTLNVNVNATPTVVNTNCSNPSGGSVTIVASGGLPPYQYSMNGGAFQSSNSFTGLTQGIKTITVIDAFCGTITRTATISFTDNLTLTTNPAIDTTVCAGAPVPLVATSATGATYAWTPTAGLSNPTVTNPTAIVNSNTNYTVTATLNNCVRTKTIPVLIKASPSVSAGPDVSVVAGDAIALMGSGSAGTISWTPDATLAGANTYTPTAMPATSTTYTLKVTDLNGCTSTDDVVVTVIAFCIKPMDAFTPNGDGMNDLWLSTRDGACTNQVSVTIFNRYGSVVYKNDNYQNDWNGMYKGEPLPDGTYYYSITYRLINGTQLLKKGSLTILR